METAPHLHHSSAGYDEKIRLPISSECALEIVVNRVEALHGFLRTEV